MDDFYDGSPTSPYIGVRGGFRAGKRRKGNSLLKRRPKETVRTYTRDIVNAEGTVVATNVRTITYKPKEG